MKYLIPFAALVLLIACESTTESETAQTSNGFDLRAELPGTWESVSLNVKINTVDDTDSTSTFIVNEENWQQILGIQPIKTKFTAQDNKYVREFRNLQGVLTDTLRGRWNVFGDTLMLVEPTATYQYLTTYNKNGLLEFRSLMDWDGDGAEDDEYQAIERKVSNYVE